MGMLLGAQGVVGWIMVASGLKPGMAAVEPVRLALAPDARLALSSLRWWRSTSASAALNRRVAGWRGERTAARALVVLAFLQIALGGLVAGHDAGLTYNTWPLMDGRFIPRGLGALEPVWLNIVDNITTIQFNHRIGAYVLAAAILAYAVMRARGRHPSSEAAPCSFRPWSWRRWRSASPRSSASCPYGLALMHQALALVLLFALVWNASVLQAPRAIVRRRRRGSRRVQASSPSITTPFPTTFARPLATSFSASG